MKVSYLFAFFIGLFINTQKSSAQNSWPFGFLKPVCGTMPSAPPVNVPTGNTCTKWPVVNNGAWNSGATWNGGTVPANNAVVCIPAGVTVRVANPTYTDATACPSNPANSPLLYIFVCGTIDFDPGGKLHLGCGSNVQLFTGGRILSANGNSDLIQIGTKEVWRFNNTNLNGPWYINDGCGSNPLGCQGAGVLPVKLGSFKAEQSAGNQIQLSWSTYFEQNSREFQIERSADNTNWTTIGSTPAKGNSSGLSSYTFFDKTPFNGTNFYRLRQVDVDDHFVFSDIVRATTESHSGIRVFPNPATTSTQIYLGHGSNRNQLIQIINSNGALVQQLNMGIGNVLTVSTSSLAPGTYLVRVMEQGKTQQQTILVKQ